MGMRSWGKGNTAPGLERFRVGGRVGSAARSHEAVSEFLGDLTSNRTQYRLGWEGLQTLKVGAMLAAGGTGVSQTSLHV